MNNEAMLQMVETFLNSGTLDFALKAVLLYLALIWVALIIWVTKDITNRTDNIAYQIASILLIVLGTPLFGLVIYLIIRPSKTLLDSYYEEIEAELLEQEAFIMKLKLEQEAKSNPEVKKHLEKTKTTRKRKPTVKSPKTSPASSSEDTASSPKASKKDSSDS